jgi:tRNA nucleotidyltransferase (CCA-adding enzyme)
VPPESLDRLRDAPALRAVAGEPGVWLVGGAVRDTLLGREPRELDLVVEGNAIAVARRAAERTGGELVVYERFGTATVRAGALLLDLASARRERYPAPGALPEVEFGASIEEDLARRDFTVNAIAVGLADGAVASVPHAEDDLRAGLLRVLHDASFADDPTRLLRLARYGARLGFRPEPHTAALAAAAGLDGVSPERLGAELRLALREPQPAALVALQRHTPALLPGATPDPERIAAVLAAAPPDARRDLLALAAAWRPEDARLRALGFTAADRRILAACADAGRVRAALDAAAAPSAVRRVLHREPVEVAVLAGGEQARRWIAEWRHARPAIRGADLLAAGLRGPAIGAGLEAATAALLDGRAPDRATQLAVALAASDAAPPPPPRG